MKNPKKYTLCIAFGIIGDKSVNLSEFCSVLERLDDVTDEEVKNAYYYAQRETMDPNSELMRKDALVARTCIPRLQNEIKKRRLHV